MALKPKRTKVATADSANKNNEPDSIEDALMHWHFQYDGEGRMPGKPWMENCIAAAVQRTLDRGMLILPKGENKYRAIRPGDIVRASNSFIL